MYIYFLEVAENKYLRSTFLKPYITYKGMPVAPVASCVEFRLLVSVHSSFMVIQTTFEK